MKTIHEFLNEIEENKKIDLSLGKKSHYFMTVELVDSLNVVEFMIKKNYSTADIKRCARGFYDIIIYYS